jgi:hypothetical protein
MNGGHRVHSFCLVMIVAESRDRFEIYFALMTIVNLMLSFWVLASWLQDDVSELTNSDHCLQTVAALKAFALRYY